MARFPFEVGKVSDKSKEGECVVHVRGICVADFLAIDVHNAL